MPRQTEEKANRATIKVHEARWRYLLRHPGFRDDLRELLSLRPLWVYPPPTAPPSEIYQKHRSLLSKWPSLGYVRLRAFRDAPELTDETLHYFESLFDPSQLGSPVTVIFDQDGTTCLGPDTLGDPRGLYLGLDLDEPTDVLMPLVEAAIRQAKEDPMRAPMRAPKPVTPRRRLDRVDFYLRVYDLFERGETFPKIARALKTPVPTVKTAYLRARREIFGTPEPSLDNFDPENHMRTCPTCSKVVTSEQQFCAEARAYVNQDVRGRDEKPIGNPDHQTGRSATATEHLAPDAFLDDSF